MENINLYKSSFRILSFYALMFIAINTNAQEINSTKPKFQSMTFYKNPYNDVSLLCLKLSENGLPIKFPKKIKTFSIKAKSEKSSKIDSTFNQKTFDKNGFLSEEIYETYVNGVKEPLIETWNLKFQKIKSKSGITYILPTHFLNLSKSKKYKDYEDFNETKIDIEDFLLIFDEYNDREDLNEWLSKFDINENLIYYRENLIINDSINKTIILKKEKNDEVLKVLNYNLIPIKDYTNPYMTNNFSYNEKGELIKISKVQRDGTISGEISFNYEYTTDNKIEKIIKSEGSVIQKFQVLYDEKGLLNKIKVGVDMNYVLYEFQYY